MNIAKFSKYDRWIASSIVTNIAPSFSLKSPCCEIMYSVLEIQDSVCVCAQSCPILCDPVDCSPQISSVHGIFQSRTLERIPISYSKGFFLTQAWNPRLLISCPAGGFFITSTTAEIQDYPIFLVFSFINKKRLHNFSIKYFSNN